MIVFIVACVIFTAVLVAAVAVTLRAIGTFGREDEAPAPRRRERGIHERDRSAKGFDWTGQRLKDQLNARNQAAIAAAEAPREPEPPSLLAAPLPEVAHDIPLGQIAVLDRPVALVEAYICTQCREDYDPHYGCACTRALDVRTNEDTADDWVGDLGPAETALPEPIRRHQGQPGRYLPGFALCRVTPIVVGALIAAVKPRVTVYPDWPTGNFPSVVAELGAAR